MALYTVLLLCACLAAVSPATGQDQRHAAIDTVTIAVRPGDSLMRIAGRMLALTPYYTQGELVEGIRRGNRLESDLLRPGQKLQIPLRQRALLDETVPKPSTFTARGFT
jgi:nucleoid-associated protein YgaU